MKLVIHEERDPGSANPRQPKMWREQLRDVRAALRKAARQRGSEREHSLVRACRAYVTIVRVGAPTGETRAFDRVAWELELKLGRIINDCIGCFAERPVPDDPPTDRRRASRSVRPRRVHR